MEERKKQSSMEALNEKNWFQYFSLIKRAYRLDAFINIIDEFENPKEYWEVLGDLWIDSENIGEDKKLWKFCLTTGPEKDKEFFMSEEDRDVFRKLPETFKVYRGYVPRKNKTGLSFTLSKDKADWFANRYKLLFNKGEVLERTVKHMSSYDSTFE